MALNQAQQSELNAFLDSDLFRRVKEEVLALASININEDRLAPETAIALAHEKGVSTAFNLLRQVSMPARIPLGPVVARRAHNQSLLA